MTIDFDRAFGLYNKGNSELNNGDVAAAIEAYQLSVSIFPHFKTLERLGESLLTAGRPLEAITYLAASVTLATDQARGLFLLSQAQLGIGEKEEAIHCLVKALELNPNYKRARQLLEAIGHVPETRT